ncbi:60S ribosomal protein L31 [Heterocephalus glaber]|uniref:60S ribosomal protein L31 n=1 Tax=Heterocephalus glaber TaxID=10181 RepID=G5BIT7_HETGA|nr:60S ribosomal protein L31 [Heterocephalus glaber]
MQVYHTLHRNSFHAFPFQLGPARIAPAKKGGKKKGHSVINVVVTQKYTINIHKHIHGVGFKKCASWTLKEIWKFVKEMGTRDVHVDTRLNKAVWAKGIRNAPHRSIYCCPENVIRMKIQQRRATRTLVTYLPVNTFKVSRQ